jgi:formate hydrogenlyase subunit 3/multisubunit Na+/H+ antiporter MnhD subunit
VGAAARHHASRGRSLGGNDRGDDGGHLHDRRLRTRGLRSAAGPSEARAHYAFWILLLAVWAALVTVFVGSDLFTLYVALELLTFGAVPLVSLDGRAETLQAALRYLLFALFGSILYLVGTALLYGTYGTLDITLLAARVAAAPATIVAVA